MKFLITTHLPDNFDPSTVTDQMAQEIHAINAELESQGRLDFAAGLYPATMAKTVRTKDGKSSITDGPYLETKEHIGGFLIIEAESMDAALEVAERGAKIGGFPTEVRQIFFHEEA